MTLDYYAWEGASLVWHGRVVHNVSCPHSILDDVIIQYYTSVLLRSIYKICVLHNKRVYKGVRVRLQLKLGGGCQPRCPTCQAPSSSHAVQNLACVQMGGPSLSIGSR